MSHDHTQPPAEIELRVKALESLLTEKGLIDPSALDELVDTYENRVGPRNGALVVAKAWSDPPIRSGCSKTARRRLPNSASPVCRAKTWSWSKTRPTSTI